MSRHFLGSLAVRALLSAACGVALVPSLLRAQTTGTALVRHAPILNGTVEGSVQQMLPESAALNSNARVTGDLFVPGTPNVVLNGSVTYGGTLNGTGSAAPTNYSITLNSGATLGHVVRRTNAITLPAVAAPPNPTGTRNVSINAAGQSAGNWATLKNLTLNGNVGNYDVPAGTYGDFTINGASSITLGVPGASQPSTYNFQRLTLNSGAQVRVVGPVVVTVKNAVTANGAIGISSNPSWLRLRISAGGLTLNGSVSLYGHVDTPNGTVIVNSGAQLVGGVSADRVTVNSNGTIRLFPFQAVNQPPVANGQSVSTPEDTAKALTLTGADPENAALTYTIMSAPAHGTLSPSGPGGAARTYTPAANWSGSDSFTFKVSDGALESAVATVTITVQPVNDAPEADPKNVTVFEDGSVPVTLSGLDVEGSPLTFSVSALPSHGTLSATAGSPVTYAPHPNFFGPDQFSYVANDGALSSFPAVVAITVIPVNDAPVVTAREVTTDEETDVATLLSGSDLDGDALTFEVVDQPDHGQFLGSPPALTYRPDDNFAQTDAFTFRAFDGQVWSAPATFTIHVNNLNDIPTAAAQSLELDEDAPLPFLATGADGDNDPLTFTVLTAPEHGTLFVGATPLTTFPHAGLTSGALRYEPAGNFHGADQFTFRTSDAVADSTPATVAFTVRPVNDAPVANGQDVITDEDTTAAFTLTGSDVEGQALTFIVSVPPAHGTLAPIAAGSAEYTYQPAADYFGPDSFTFKASDGALDSGEIVVPITVEPVNDAPTATADDDQTLEDQPKTITLLGGDVDNAAAELVYTIVGSPAFGTLTPGALPAAPGTFTYTPNPDYHGPDSFTFVVTDLEPLSSAETTFVLDVVPVNDAPTVVNLTLETPRDVPLPLTLNALDVDGDALTYAVGTPESGTLTLAGAPGGPNYTYTPPPGVGGAQTSFTFTVSDGVADPVAGVVAIQIVETNLPPAAESALLDVIEDLPKNFTLGGSDPNPEDAGTLVFVVIDQPAHGGLSGLNANLTYTPDLNYHGSDSLTFKTWDGLAYSSLATISITVHPANDAPTANGASLVVLEDVAATFELSGSDIEGDAITFTVLEGPAQGVVSPASGAGPFTYTPASDFHGADSFTFIAHDGDLDSAPATVALTVQSQEDPPVTANHALEIFVNMAVTFTLPGSDADGDVLTFTLDAPLHGSVTPSAGTGPFTYTPAQHLADTDSFGFTVTDGKTPPVAAVVSVNVINRLPIAAASAESATEDTPTEITLVAADSDGQPLSYTIVDHPAHGELTPTLTPSTFIFTPTANYAEGDSFTYRVNDGYAASNLATVTITIDPVNDAPETADLAVTTHPNAPVEFTLTATDVDGDTLTITFDTPQHGAISPTAAAKTFSYTPEANYAGADSVAFTVSDGIAAPVAGTLTIAVENRVPTAGDAAPTVVEDTPTAITLTASDPDGQPLAYTIVDAPQHGALTPALSPSTFTFTPEANFAGTDDFTFRVNDGYADSDLATVTITIDPQNDAPEAEDIGVTTFPNAAVDFTLSATDVDGDALTFAIGTPAHGTLTPGADGVTFTYTPEANFAGGDSVVFTVSDGTAPAVERTVDITVQNRAPSAAGAPLFVVEDTPTLVSLSGTDPDGQPLSYVVVDHPQNGHVTYGGSGPLFTYHPNADFHGADSFTFKVNDGYDDSNVATIFVTVESVPDAPVVAMTISTPNVVVSTADAITIHAQASSVEGAITRVEFFDGPTKLGEITSGPFEFNWTDATPGEHRIHVRAHDAAGGFVDSPETVVVVLAALPYLADFENAGGYQAGAIDGQLGWTSAGLAEIRADAAASGARSLALAGGGALPQAAQVFAPATSSDVVFVDFFAQPSVEVSPTVSVLMDAEVALLAVTADSASTGRVLSWSGNGTGGGFWLASSVTFATDASGAATAWRRLTLRLDYVADEWDLYADGRMVAAGMGVRDAGHNHLGRLTFVGPNAGTARFDDLYAGGDNPLFNDADHDGIDDVYEAANGMNTAVKDRTGDLDSDGLSNLREYILGTRANLADTDGDGMPDGWEDAHDLDPTVLDGGGDADNDELSNLGEYQAGTNPHLGDTDGDGMPDGWEVEHSLRPLDPNDAVIDADGDHASNLQEFQNDTDPNDFFNGATPLVTIDGATTVLVRPGETALLPLSATIGAGAGGLENAPFTFLASDASVLLIAAVGEAGGQPTLAGRAGAGGTATAWVSLTSGASGVHAVTLRVLSPGAGPIDVQFTIVALVAAGPLSAGSDQSLWIDDAGIARAWGRNTSGQLGDGTRVNRTPMLRVSGLGGVTRAAAMGELHALAAGADGTVAAWGDNGFGQLGDGTTTSRTTSAAVPGLANILTVAAGDAHSLALNAAGVVFAWGANQHGQLGDGTTQPRTAASPVSGLAPSVAIAAGARHSAALTADGRVWTWGSNAFGQQGGTAPAATFNPALVVIPEAVVALASGRDHLLAIGLSGQVWSWGANYAGQLGLGDDVGRTVPTPIAGLPAARAVAAGAGHSALLTPGGAVWTWGSGTEGQLGTGGLASELTPVEITAFAGARALAAGRDHTVVLRADGTLLASGRNAAGQLGADTGGAAAPTPVNVAPPTD